MCRIVKKGALAGSLAVVLGLAMAQGATVPGGGSSKTDCIARLTAEGVPFPAGKAVRGLTCYDGDSCDTDGARNGVCVFSASVCLNVTDPALPKCRPSDVASVKIGGSGLDAVQAAVAALALPTAAPVCSAVAAVSVPVRGPGKNGEFAAGRLKIKLKARTSSGKVDKDQYRLVCLPTSRVPVPSTTTSTTLPTSTGTPGAGLDAEILAAAISPAGVVTVTFKLTDSSGVPVAPVSAATSDPDQARVRSTISRLEVNDVTQDGFTSTFTRYQNYITTHVTSPITGDSADQPTYDGNGSFAVLDASAGTFVYTFGTALPGGFPATLTHTVGAQIERTFEGTRLVANPVFDFVPAGGAVSTVRELTETEQCNACHGTLAVHGGGRREIRLCQLCHTDQNIDPDTGNSVEFKVMVHKIHRGKELPTIAEGSTIGAKYSIIGFGQNETVFGERVKVCTGGTTPTVECAADADCPGGGTCTGSTAMGVGFPQDIRNCEKCHAGGATAADFKERPAAAACATCHDDVNPSEGSLNGLDPGTNHVVGPQSDAFCRLCHTPEGAEFGISVEGAHTIPERSATLTGLVGTILTASGAPGGAVTITFKITDGAGTALPTLTGKICNGGTNALASCTVDGDCAGGGNCTAMNRVRFVINGPSTDFGGSSTPFISATVVGSGSSGMLTGPDGSGVYTYVTSASNSLPADATGTWRVGLEARRPRTVNGASVNEGLQNAILDFSVDGTAVVPRRQVVDIANCQRCHGTFSKDFHIHGNLRNQTQYCILCHNPNVTDFADRAAAVTGSGANPTDEPIHFKRFIHRLHTGEEQETKPYLIYGSPNNFSEVRYPRDLRDCAACHEPGTQLLPLPDDVLPTRLSRVDTTVTPAVEVTTGTIPPIQAACLACHDGEDARAHAETMTTASGEESCGVCHEEGRIEAVSEVHAIAP
jgi:hypothetical protein